MPILTPASPRSTRLVLELEAADADGVARLDAGLAQRLVHAEAPQPALEPLQALRRVQVGPLQQPLHRCAADLESPALAPYGRRFGRRAPRAQPRDRGRL